MYMYPCKIHSCFVSVLKINENGIMLYISFSSLGILEFSGWGRRQRGEIKTKTQTPFTNYSFSLEYFPTSALLSLMLRVSFRGLLFLEARTPRLPALPPKMGSAQLAACPSGAWAWGGSTHLLLHCLFSLEDGAQGGKTPSCLGHCCIPAPRQCSAWPERRGLVKIC